MLNHRFHPLTRAIFWIAITMVMLVPIQVLSERESGTFTGTWSASGNWQPLHFMDDREVFTFTLAGHVNIQDAAGQARDFWAECIGLWDSETGGTSRCVWRDTDGEDEVFIVLSGGHLIAKDIEVHGDIVGGTGTLKGISGNIDFTWTTLYRNETERTLTGYAKKLIASYRYPGDKK